jgi:uncharacterized membrane protein YbaN (DUF454 family)
MVSEQVRGIRRALYIVLAAICLGLGLLGAALPGLPTTPFLLLMSYLLVRAWPWLHGQVLRLPVVGNTLRDWDERRGVRRGVKILAATWVVVAVGLVILATGLTTILNLLIAGLALVGLCVIWRLPTVQAQAPAHPAECKNY